SVPNQLILPSSDHIDEAAQLVRLRGTGRRKQTCEGQEQQLAKFGAGHGRFLQNGFTKSRILVSHPRSTWSLMSPRPVNSTRASAIRFESTELSGAMSAGRSTPEI